MLIYNIIIELSLFVWSLLIISLYWMDLEEWPHKMQLLYKRTLLSSDKGAPRGLSESMDEHAGGDIGVKCSYVKTRSWKKLMRRKGLLARSHLVHACYGGWSAFLLAISAEITPLRSLVRECCTMIIHGQASRRPGRAGQRQQGYSQWNSDM